jgi:hypothetical protein
MYNSSESLVKNGAQDKACAPFVVSLWAGEVLTTLGCEPFSSEAR